MRNELRIVRPGSIFESFCQRPYQWMFLLGIVLFKNISKPKSWVYLCGFQNPCFVFVLILLWHMIVIFSFRRVEIPHSYGCGSLYYRFPLPCFWWLYYEWDIWLVVIKELHVKLQRWYAKVPDVFDQSSGLCLFVESLRCSVEEFE